MTVTLSISTYNRPDALRLCLESALHQSRLPDEIIVVDDGSTSDTALVVSEMAALTKIPVKHLWQPDEGFRLARARNMGISAANGDYIVQIDGDMVLTHHFIADHVAMARPGYYVKGGRIRLNAKSSERWLHRNRPPRFFSPFMPGIHHDRAKAIRLPLLGRIFSPFYQRTGTGIGANTAFWKKDLEAVNGFDEAFEGWGGEDTDIELRLQSLGVKTFKLWRLGIAFHLWHREGGGNPDAHRRIYTYIFDKLRRGDFVSARGLNNNYGGTN